MANVCKYKGLVKGKKNACYIFFGSMPCLDDKVIVEENGTDENFSLSFEGDCKWHVDAYCKPWEGEYPVEISNDSEEALSSGYDFWGYTVQERSKMFEVEVFCNSADIEDYNPHFGPNEKFEHYINGDTVDGECPEELRIKVENSHIEEYVNTVCPYGLEKYFEDENPKLFICKYENPIISEILSKYEYKSDLEGMKNPTNIDWIEDMIPDYKGVTTLEKLTLTLFSAFRTFGELVDGFEIEVNERLEEILESYISIYGHSLEVTEVMQTGEEWYECEFFNQGYDFELKDGKYIATYRECEGDW